MLRFSTKLHGCDRRLLANSTFLLKKSPKGSSRWPSSRTLVYPAVPILAKRRFATEFEEVTKSQRKYLCGGILERVYSVGCWELNRKFRFMRLTQTSSLTDMGRRRAIAGGNPQRDEFSLPLLR
jgi:hypothetical protein